MNARDTVMAHELSVRIRPEVYPIKWLSICPIQQKRHYR